MVHLVKDEEGVPQRLIGQNIRCGLTQNWLQGPEPVNQSQRDHSLFTQED